MALVNFVDRALAVVGYTAGTDGSYEALVAAGETESAARGMATMSGCALVCRGLLRAHCEDLGIAPPAVLCAPYVVGSVLGVMQGLALRAGAIASATSEPEPGDLVWFGGPEHLEVFVGDGWRVAGGERDTAGRETIRCVTRSGASLDDAPAQPAIALAPRQVLRIVRAAALLPYLEGGGS